MGELDGLRGVAILLVLLGHAHVLGNGPMAVAGVVVFFVLSGYLITGLLMRELDTRGRIALREFFIRRAARLFPALAVMLVVMVPPLLLAGVPETGAGAAAALAYVANLARAHAGLGGPFGHAWSLSLEEQFYVVWPFVLPLVVRGRRTVAVLLGLAVCSLAVRVVVGTSGSWEWAAFSPVTTVGPLLLGAALALKPWPAAWWSPPVGVGLLVLACIDVRYASVWALANVLPAALGAAMLVVARPVWLRPGWLRWFGRRSYAMYLWHLPLMWLPPIAALGAPWSGLAAAALSVAVAAVSWHVVEAPVIARARRETGRHRPMLAEAAAGDPQRA